MTPVRQRELDLMRQMVDEAEEIVMSPNRDLCEFGSLLHEGWNLKRSLTGKISNPHLDEIYEAGLSAGALGGKLLGAGGGGFMLFLCLRSGKPNSDAAWPSSSAFRLVFRIKAARSSFTSRRRCTMRP